MIPGVTDSTELLHAYLCAGARATAKEELVAFFEKLGIPAGGNPDFHVHEVDTLSIDDARRIATHASRRAVGNLPKVFVLSFRRATREAQNALLKCLEEPGAQTHFFILVDAPHVLLPTLRSRLSHVNVRGERLVSASARSFLAATPGERMAMVSDVVESKDRARAVAFLRDVLAARYASEPVERMDPDARAALRELAALESYLADQSASVKLILEHTALRL